MSFGATQRSVLGFETAMVQVLSSFVPASIPAVVKNIHYDSRVHHKAYVLLCPKKPKSACASEAIFK